MKILDTIVELVEMPTRETNPDLQQTEGANPRWYIRAVVWARDGSGDIQKERRRVYLGDVATMNEKQALKERARVVALLNDPGAIAKRTVLTFNEVLNLFERDFLGDSELVSVSTQGKYRSLIKNHLRPGFGQMELGDITHGEVSAWIRRKADAGMSWATRQDLRNLVGSIFTKAEHWGLWEGKNPARGVAIGRKKAAREKRKMTVEQIRALLAALRPDVRLLCMLLLCMLLLFSTLRISEALGLKWGMIDYQRGLVLVRKRFYRGDLDETKTEKSERDVPLGRLVYMLERPAGAKDEDYVFNFSTFAYADKEHKEGAGITRDDRTIRRYFLRPVAEKLGIYYKGFGFHSFRREAITGIASESDMLLAQLMAGHTRPDTTMIYALRDMPRAAAAIEDFQLRILGDGTQEQ